MYRVLLFPLIVYCYSTKVDEIRKQLRIQKEKLIKFY